MIPAGRLLWAGGAVLCVLFMVSLAVGPAPLSFENLVQSARSGEAGADWVILTEIRLPRTLLALLIGMGLGLSGAALQGLLRNPLADPGVIGVSSLSALGAVIAFYTGLSALMPLALPMAAILFSLVGVIALEGLAGRGGALSLILAGVALSSLAGAMTSLALTLSPNPYASLEIVFWMLGSLNDRSMEHVALAVPFMVCGAGLLALAAPALNALTLGEAAAASLGVDLRRTRRLVIAGASLCVGASVAVSGVIGFVGLLAPHLMRPLVGHGPARLLPASALAGGCLLVASDILVRLIAPTADLKLGVVTALIGAPLFLYLALRARTEAAS
jgi:iron complex transport system permease protein